MNVKTLIERLQKFNPEAVVKVHHRDDEEVLFTVGIVGMDNVMWLETESDCDLSSELEARFENALEEWRDELDFYMDLLETGITVDMVRKYMDDEHADHMQQFCEEHGLI